MNVINCLKLFKPSIVIQFDSSFSEEFELLSHDGFKYTMVEDRGPIVNGTAWLDEGEKVVLHLYFNENSKKLESIMIHSAHISTKDELESSFLRKEKWLEKYYDKATRIINNPPYKEGNTERILERFRIGHFIKDRFGDEEGIYIEVLCNEKS